MSRLRLPYTKSKTCVVVAGPHGPSLAGNRTSPGDRETWDAHTTTTQTRCQRTKNRIMDAQILTYPRATSRKAKFPHTPHAHARKSHGNVHGVWGTGIPPTHHTAVGHMAVDPHGKWQDHMIRLQLTTRLAQVTVKPEKRARSAVSRLPKNRTNTPVLSTRHKP